MNLRLLLAAGTFSGFFALTAVAAPPFSADQLLQGGKMLRAPHEKFEALANRAILSNVREAAVAQSVRIDRHVTHWVQIDVPAAGPIGTFPVVINDLGEIAGNYNDASPDQLQHGFLRRADGTIVSFDPLGSQLTSPQHDQS